MAAPLKPQNFVVQQGNGVVYISWNLAAGATLYPLERSVDNVTWAVLASPSINNYLDASVTVNTQYFYRVSASDGVNVSGPTDVATTIPTQTGVESLLSLRTQAKQRADMVSSTFLTDAEWNNNINESYFELYDLLKNNYEDWFFAKSYQLTTNGASNAYNLPDGSSAYLASDGSVAKPFYSLLGVDCGLGAANNAWVTLHKYDFIERNRYIYPNLTSTFFGVFNLAYRLMGNQLHFIPTPSANQVIQVWYIPRMQRMLRDIDVADCVSGWAEYIIVDAAIKALQKEESDVSVLEAQKVALTRRIEDSAMNRDAGQPDTISNTRNQTGDGRNGWGDGSYGGN